MTHATCSTSCLKAMRRSHSTTSLRTVAAGDALIVDKGVRRALVAGADGVRYVTAHIRRGGLQIAPLKD